MTAKTTDFIKRELVKPFFENPNIAFPNMGFVKQGMTWKSPLKLDLTPPHEKRKDKSVIAPKYPHRVYEQGEGSLTFIDLYMRQNNKDFHTALEELAGLYRLVVPYNYNGEDWHEQQQKQDKVATIAEEMAEALFSPQGEKALQYLHARGYEDELIEYGRLGYLTKDAAAKLRTICYKFPYNAEKENPLVIPYISYGNIYGFVFRRIDDKEGAKYMDAFITERDTKAFHLYGFDNLTTNSDNLTIVEGELDALRAQYVGIPNVVAASGSGLCDEAVKEIKRHGINSVTLLFDTEDTAEKREKMVDKIKSCYEILKGNDIDVYVSEFPLEKEGEKVDTDSYLNTHTAKELADLIKKGAAIALYLCDKLLTRYEKTAKREGVSDRLFKEAKKDVIRTALHYTDEATERKHIYEMFASSVEGIEITASDIEEEAEAMRQKMLKEEQESQIKRIRDTFSAMVNNGQIEAADAYLRDELAKLQTTNQDEKYSALLQNATSQEREDSYTEQPNGLKTPYRFRKRNGEYDDFLLPSGALTYICGQTSHGKTKMLENLALHLATTDEGEGDVLYFSYEEGVIQIEQQFINLYANIHLSANNLRSINSYYTNGKRWGLVKKYADTAGFLRKKDELLKLLADYKLRIFNIYYDGRELAEAIQTYSRKRKIKAVFVDYVQRISIKDSRKTKKEELEEICGILINAALELGIPVVLGAQLNRQAESPIDMDVTYIADASNIEHSANVVMLLWNSAVEPRGNWYRNTKAGELKLSAQAQRIADRGFTTNEAGQLYALLAKNRGGERGIDAVLQFDGNTGKISAEIEIEEDHSAADALTPRK